MHDTRNAKETQESLVNSSVEGEQFNGCDRARYGAVSLSYREASSSFMYDTRNAPFLLLLLKFASRVVLLTALVQEGYLWNTNLG
jgi:hypothetical protein